VRYETAMLMVVAAALAASASSGPPAQGAVSVQARATIRIVSATRLRVGSERSEEGLPVRLASIRGEDGGRQPARLVEFE